MILYSIKPFLQALRAFSSGEIQKKPGVQKKEKRIRNFNLISSATKDSDDQTWHM